MTSKQTHLVTHTCRGCDRHFPLHLVRQVHPAEHTPEGEIEVLVCPACNSYDIELLKEVASGH